MTEAITLNYFTLLNIFISSSVGFRMSSHHVLLSLSLLPAGGDVTPEKSCSKV